MQLPNVKGIFSVRQRSPVRGAPTHSRKGLSEGRSVRSTEGYAAEQRAFACGVHGDGKHSDPEAFSLRGGAVQFYASAGLRRTRRKQYITVGLEVSIQAERVFKWERVESRWFTRDARVRPPSPTNK